MKTTFKTFVISLILLVAIVAPACRSSRKKTPPVTTATQATDTVPNVPTVTTTEVAVSTQPPDFVREDAQPTEEPLPTDVEELNRVVQQRGLIRDAFFEYDAATLSDDAQAALTASATWLRNNPGYGLLVEGHCDERGTEQYNLALGDRRAHTAREYLLALGISPARIRTVSYGEERPFDEGHDESAWRQNRRAHLVLTGSNR